MERFSNPFHVLLAMALRECIVFVEGMWNADAYHDIQEWINDVMEGHYQTSDRAWYMQHNRRPRLSDTFPT